MGLFKALYEAQQEELRISDKLTLEQAYEQLYNRVNRLQDMDDFSSSLLKSIYNKMQNGQPFDKAFEQTINTEYEFADFDYFKDVFNLHKENLFELLKKSVLASTVPSRTWASEIKWMFDHETITYNDAEYTLSQLKDKLDKGDEE